MQVAWQPWKQNITCKRLNHGRVKVIDYLGCAWDIKVAQLGAIFNQGQKNYLQNNDILACHYWICINRFLHFAASTVIFYD